MKNKIGSADRTISLGLAIILAALYYSNVISVTLALCYYLLWASHSLRVISFLSTLFSFWNKHDEKIRILVFAPG